MDRRSAPSGATRGGGESALDVLTLLTMRSIQFLNVVFVQCRNGEPSRPKDIAARFKDCSPQFAAAQLRRLEKAGAAERVGGHWWATEVGIAAMQLHYREDWTEAFTAEDEAKALGHGTSPPKPVWAEAITQDD